MPKVGGTKDPDLAKLRALAPDASRGQRRREPAGGRRRGARVRAARDRDASARAARQRCAVRALRRRRSARAARSRGARARARRGASRSPTTRRRRFRARRVLYLIWRKPWMTVSRATYVSASLALVGWDTLPATADVRYPSDRRRRRRVARRRSASCSRRSPTRFASATQRELRAPLAQARAPRRRRVDVVVRRRARSRDCDGARAAVRLTAGRECRP